MGGANNRFVSVEWKILIWITVIFTVLGVPFTLWWWKLADRWADDEKKRFKVKPDRREKVVVKRGDGEA
jgi:hypothetical protein